MSRLRILKRHGFLCLGTLVVIVIAVVVGMVLINQQSLMVSIDSLRERHDLPLLLWRLSLYAGLAAYWPHWIVKIKNKPSQVSLSRWPVVACIAVYELMIAQNALAILVHALGR